MADSADDNQTLLIRVTAGVLVLLVCGWLACTWTGRDFTIPDLFVKILLGVVLTVVYSFYRGKKTSKERKRVKLLIVEDNPQQQNIIRWGLQQSNNIFDLMICTTAEDALGMLRSASVTSSIPDLIILDLGLPGMSGVEFLSVIKTDFELYKIPVIVITKSRRDEVTEQTLDNCCYFLERGRGASTTSLIEAVNACLSGTDKPDERKRVRELERQNELMRKRLHDYRNVLGQLIQSQEMKALDKHAGEIATQASELFEKEKLDK